MRIYLFALLATTCLTLTGCATTHVCRIYIADSSSEQTRTVAQVNSILSRIAQEHQFTDMVCRKEKNGEPASFYYKSNSNSMDAPIAILFLHKQLVITISSEMGSTQELKTIKKQILSEIKESIPEPNRVRAEQENVARPWFDT